MMGDGTIACGKDIWQIGRHRASDLASSANAERHAIPCRQQRRRRDAGRRYVAFVAERLEKSREASFRNKRRSTDVGNAAGDA